MDQEQLVWISKNQNIFIRNTKAEQLKRDYVYHLYNLITGENKKPNGCGSWATIPVAGSQTPSVQSLPSSNAVNPPVAGSQQSSAGL